MIYNQKEKKTAEVCPGLKDEPFRPIRGLSPFPAESHQAYPMKWPPLTSSVAPVT